MKSALLLVLLLGCTGFPAESTGTADTARGEQARPVPSAGKAQDYAWLEAGRYNPSQTLGARFAPPQGYQRVTVAPGTFGAWLRHLPLLPGKPLVKLHNGQLKNRQDVHAAVLDLDVGKQDLQQCADAVIRLRAEYQFSRQPDQIHFHLTSGDDIRFQDWYSGTGFRVAGDAVQPAPRPAEAPTHTSLRRYLDQIFTYAGTLSLSRELRTTPLAQVQPGDVLIHGGSPGHAVLVLDVAVQPSTGRRVALLAQSYMPAQQMHVLENRWDNTGLGAWFLLDPAARKVSTPEWTFDREELGRFE
ncbi:hypothetical protein FY528_20060 [Hymenobacter lutimineralis]|uniref:DUF4846 domain-containing protein n=1 Tax=Hymenobacter lutimineralis TaxID=2606448 RepID=A0A5D6USF4_9BACT|nr:MULTISPECIES: DUF4846 domain-containing protein [Hymenobacter]QIX63103.1 DUF4846 domain-containing protein [Hymenobacter sp. BT18]TYZ05980.1 hypothetical protein FY528_20060 [Hymenobacter lutimineralis]